jgi:hypothetical protein
MCLKLLVVDAGLGVRDPVLHESDLAVDSHRSERFRREAEFL